jgi:hypothetical protein
MHLAGWLLLLPLVAPRTVQGGTPPDRCPRGGCDFGSTTTVPSTPATSTTLPAEEAFLQSLLDDIQRAWAMTLPLRDPIVLTGAASARGRIKATIAASSFGHPDSALLAKGKVRIRRSGAFELKLHPSRTGRRFESLVGTAAIVIEVWYRTKAGTQQRATVIWV